MYRETLRETKHQEDKCAFPEDVTGVVFMPADCARAFTCLRGAAVELRELTSRIGTWARSLVPFRRARHPRDLVVVHGICWAVVGTSPLRQPVCPVCVPTRGTDALLLPGYSDEDGCARDQGWVVFRCPICGWNEAITREQERQGRGGAARHAIARAVGMRAR
jgi:hypothetical protein